MKAIFFYIEEYLPEDTDHFLAPLELAGANVQRFALKSNLFSDLFYYRFQNDFSPEPKDWPPYFEQKVLDKQDSAIRNALAYADFALYSRDCTDELHIKNLIKQFPNTIFAKYKTKRYIEDDTGPEDDSFIVPDPLLDEDPIQFTSKLIEIHRERVGKAFYVFVSYVREDFKIIDKLKNELEAKGITVWLDRDQIRAGEQWQAAIRKAIREGAFFIACFSDSYGRKAKSYMNAELGIAVEELRLRQPDRIWLIPVRLSDCKVPEYTIREGISLRDFHYIDLFENWDLAVQKIIDVITANHK